MKESFCNSFRYVLLNFELKMFRVFASKNSYKPVFQVYYECSLYNLSLNRMQSDTAQLDFNFLCDPSNTEKIRLNIQKRKGVSNIDEVLSLHRSWLNSSPNERDLLKSKLMNAALKIPNMSHPDVAQLEEEPLVVKEIEKLGERKEVSFKLLTFEEIADKLNLCRTDNISNFTGPRSYYFLDQLALLEQALIKYTLVKLRELNFSLLSVPDILPRNIIEMCGMETRGERNQVYALDETKWNNLCLSGTAEMGISYYLHNKKFIKEELPVKIAAVSRCFRAETSKISEEKGIYRVHQFTKLEMFGVSSSNQSESLLKEFVQIQEDIFKSLGLTFRILDMPPHELGAPAARKYDIEAWLPGKARWGEISSASNCTDYQSRRLGITLGDSYPHTINGTACAVPRLIIALLETYQKKDGSVELPKVLEPFLGFQLISKSRIPKLNAFKPKKRLS